MNPVIYDGYGEKYRVELAEVTADHIFHVWHDSAQVAEARVTVEAPLLLLNDITVSDRVLYPEKKVVLWFRRMAHCPQKPINYRTRGIGSALISLVVDWAKERKLIGIIGEISTEDLSETPHLLSWYAHRGFRFVEGGRSGKGQVMRSLVPKTLAKAESERPDLQRRSATALEKVTHNTSY